MLGYVGQSRTKHAASGSGSATGHSSKPWSVSDKRVDSRVKKKEALFSQGALPRKVSYIQKIKMRLSVANEGLARFAPNPTQNARTLQVSFKIFSCTPTPIYC